MDTIEQLVHHIVMVWDESDHVSEKRVGRLAELFWEGYLAAFPHGRDTTESPAVLATGSPIFATGRVRSFLHNGTFIPHTGKNKDLAIAKFCSTGFVDQDEKFHFILDQMREARFKNGEPPMHGNRAAMVCLVTSDQSSGMNDALKWVLAGPSSFRTSFSVIQTDKSLSQGDKRMTNAGWILGTELKSRFVRIEAGGLLLRIERESKPTWRRPKAG